MRPDLILPSVFTCTSLLQGERAEVQSIFLISLTSRAVVQHLSGVSLLSWYLKNVMSADLLFKIKLAVNRTIPYTDIVVRNALSCTVIFQL